MDQVTSRRSAEDEAAAQSVAAPPEEDGAEASTHDVAARDRGPAPERPAGDDRHDILALAPDHQTGQETATGENETPRMPSRWIFVVAVLLLAGGLAWGVYRHWKQSSAASETQNQQGNIVPEVRVVKAQAEDGPVDLSLPGQTQPYASAAIFPRATGYITERRVDIGSRVRKGDLLVHISSPDLDQQLEQAIAQLGQVQASLLQAQATISQSEANLNLAKVNLQRAQALVGQGYETLQNRDQLQANQVAQAANLEASRAAVKVAEANVKGQQAAIDRLKALTGFEDVRAPFDGVVTVRNVDLGTLVNADSAAGSAMFTVDEDDILRVFVQVPQNASVGVKDGLEAKVEVPQYPGRTFVGRVTRSSTSLQSSARTLTVEVDIPNEAGTLRAGLYAYVSLAIPRSHPDVVLPAETLIFDQHGTRVAVVGDGEKIRMVPIHITRDLGTSIEVDQGPPPGDRVVSNPPATLRDGLKVKLADEGAGGEAGAAPPDTAKAGRDGSGDAGGSKGDSAAQR